MFDFRREYYLRRSPDGLSHLGGDTPEGFTIPSNNCPGSFQYLGYLDNRDRGFRFLDFGFHLTCPIYMDIEKVWLDYSNPTRPEIINVDEINGLTTAHEDLDKESVIIYEKTPLSTTPIRKNSSHRLGLTGRPRWIQADATPFCIRNNRKMRFLCQLEYQYKDPVRTRHTNVIPQDPHFTNYFSEMNFWGSGDLYVFYEPASRIACYFIQNT